MKNYKKTKIKVFKFVDTNSEFTLDKTIEPTINGFINSDEVSSVVDIKVNTEIINHYITAGVSSSHSSNKTDIAIYYTIIYIPVK